MPHKRRIETLERKVDEKKPKTGPRRIRVRDCSLLCMVPGCEEKTLFIRRHLFERPLLLTVNDTLELAQRMRIMVLQLLANALFGTRKSLEDMRNTLDQRHLIFKGWNITKSQANYMRQLCRCRRWTAPASFLLDPLNSLACLIHWRALLATPEVLDTLRNELDPLELTETGAWEDVPSGCMTLEPPLTSGRMAL